MYELFLLGKLLDRPWYGYEFQQVLSAFVGPQRRVSWGTIYPLFQRVQREGLIKALARRGPPGGRDKQEYAITSAGKKRFFELMQTERRHDADYRETFRAKLGNFSRVPFEVRNEIARAYVKRLAAIHDHTTRMYGLVQQAPDMKGPERDMILRAIRHERSLAQADLCWMRKEMVDFLGPE